jgi:hypothetical protein
MNEPKEPIRNRIKKYIADNEVNRKVKTHFEEHKVAYSIAATAVVTSIVTAGVTIALTRKPSTMAKVNMASTNNNGHHNTINNIKEINIYLKRVSKYGNPLGRPGIKLIDLTDDRRYESKKLIMANLGVSDYKLEKHLNGKSPDLNGHVIMRVDDYKKQLMAAVDLRESLRRQEMGYPY